MWPSSIYSKYQRMCSCTTFQVTCNSVDGSSSHFSISWSVYISSCDYYAASFLLLFSPNIKMTHSSLSPLCIRRHCCQFDSQMELMTHPDVKTHWRWERWRRAEIWGLLLLPLSGLSVLQREFRGAGIHWDGRDHAGTRWNATEDQGSHCQTFIGVNWLHNNTHTVHITVEHTLAESHQINTATVTEFTLVCWGQTVSLSGMRGRGISMGECDTGGTGQSVTTTTGTSTTFKPPDAGGGTFAVWYQTCEIGGLLFISVTV